MGHKKAVIDQQFVVRMQEIVKNVGGQNAMARAAEINQSTVGSYLNGAEPTRPQLIALAKASGPSIRLAEAMAQAWGNMQFGIRELDQRNGESTVQAFAWDVETNTRREVTFQIPHKRYTKKGSYMLEDPRDIYEMVANQGARRLRACILAVIPGDVTEAAVNQCELTMRAKADTSPDAIKKMVAAFAGFGITKEQLEKRIQRRLDTIQPAQVVSLQKIYISLRDGMSNPVDWFEQEDGGSPGPGEKKTATDKLKDKLKSGTPGANVEPRTVAESATVDPAAEAPSDPQPPEQPKISDKAKVFMKEINSAAEQGGSLGVDTWRAKHHGRVANACGGEANKDYQDVMDYAEMTYQAMVEAEKQ